MKGDIHHPLADLSAERGKAGYCVQCRLKDCSQWEEGKYR